MKAKDLIKLLRRHPEAEVLTYDGDAEAMVPVTGTVSGVEDAKHGRCIELCTDSDECEDEPELSAPIERYELGDDGKAWALFCDSEGDCPNLVGVLSDKEDAEKLGEYVFEPTVEPCLVNAHGVVLVANHFEVDDHAKLDAVLRAKGLKGPPHD